MEQQITEQKQLGDMIRKLLSNMKKDSASRKTEEYFGNRLNMLQHYWGEFQKNHDEIKEKLPSEHNYFKQQFYEQVQKVYEEASKYIVEGQEGTTTSEDDIQGDKTASTPQVLTSNIGKLGEIPEKTQVLLQRQHIELQLLNRAIINISQKMDQMQFQGQCEYEIKTLSDQWKDITNLHKEILVSENKFTDKYFSENKYEEAEEKFKGIVYQLHERISNLSTNRSTQGDQANNSHVALPRITLPVFEGDYEKWTSFHDIFMQVIHKNNTLGDAEKMQYLKTHTKGEASKLIQHLEVSNANYKIAYDMLIGRYNNERILFTKYLDNILNLPILTNESSENIKQLHDTTLESLRAISNMGMDTSSWGPIISYIISKKLDKETNRLYEQSLSKPRSIQNFDELMEFLEKRFQSLEALGEVKGKPETYKQTKAAETWSKKWPIKSHHTNSYNCIYCQEKHSIFYCRKFRALSIYERTNFVRRQRICNVCLSHKDFEKCNSQTKCQKCNRWHHTFLHYENTRGLQKGDRAKPQEETKTLTHVTNTNEQEKVTSHVAKKIIQSEQREVLLATAFIKVRGIQGNFELLRALIDPGSQASFITESAAQLLALPRQRMQAQISGVGRSEAGTVKGKILAEISPRFSSNFQVHGELLVLPRVTDELPRKKLADKDAQLWEQYILADPTYDVPGPIDVLIGIDLYKHIILEGIKKSNSGLVAQKTEVGWILSGAIETQKPNSAISSMIAIMDPDEQLAKFWEIEEVSGPIAPISEEDRRCEEHFEKTHQRGDDGTYTVQIPFKNDREQLGESKKKAVARFLQLEKRFNSDKQLEAEYKQFMGEYLKLDHMKLVEHQNSTGNAYYIPHQAVIKEDSDTTKLRVVFDASSKTSNGKSLNDVMYTGPRLQQDLLDILLRWRKHQIVLTADIEKMYRQIKISTDDQSYHRIMWRFSKSEPIQEYQLTTVTYGTASAPYLAIKTLQQLAEDEKAKYPAASKIAKRDFYVDDLLTGAESQKEAKELQKEITSLMKSGGFNIRKWTSNVPRMDQLKITQSIQLGEKNEGTRKTLGVHWCPTEDVLTYKAKISNSKKATKRNILSEIARIFDPLGILAPIVIKAKILMQELWIGNYSWDEELPAGVKEKWRLFQEQLPAVEEITVPRWIHYKKNQKIELHGFCDASEKAYGAVIYIKSINTEEEEEVTVRLLTAKSRVAPVKMKKTLPKLELCAAALLAKMVKKVLAVMEMEDVTVYTWTDSMITLAWIKASPDKWKNFVANRVAEIQQQIGNQCWHHVKSEDNPADLVSRGLDPSKLQTHSLWWNGPAWLQQRSVSEILLQTLNPTTEEEKRKQKTIVATSVVKENFEIINRFSSLRRLVRVIAYCRRFITKCKQEECSAGFLTAKELKDSLHQLIAATQLSEMRFDIECIKKNGQVDAKSPCLNLLPFIDDDGIMRVGGRIQYSALSYNEKHPIIIHHSSSLSKLIILDAHHQTLHGGNQATMAYVRRKYWILRAKPLIRQVINRCMICARYKAVATQQLMGELPAPRVTPTIPFTHTGIDYAGPIQLRMSKGRGNKSYKGYICIFVCLSTKAIHIEAVSDMTTNAFIAAFRRFTARRGKCSHIYSDNGTTFVGANKVLEAEFRQSFEQNPVEALAAEGIQWHFIPPASPHFGGLWEAGVKSIKYHLKRVIGDQTLTFEELSTVLYQIEACLNSRPLAPLSNDPNDVTVITPGHFLTGRALVTPVESVDNTINRDHISRWTMLQKMKNDFWKVWSTEYLSRLQQRSKWKTTKENVMEGDVVLLKEENISPNNWPLARITQVHPGKDGIVRVVTLQTKGRVKLKRPVTKICALPMEQPPDDPKLKEKTTRKSGMLTTVYIFVAIISSIMHGSDGNYTITSQNPGIYIEHVGYAKINRGIFRIGMNFSLSEIQEDRRTMSSTVEQITKLCNESEKISEDTHCRELIHHIGEQQQEIVWKMDSIQSISGHRPKRGLLGKFLTTVFGVNDEVYRDIDKLDKNQHQLIETSKHQSKLMLSTMTNVKEMEDRINTKLENFRTKFNQGLQAINKMKAWYRTTDSNQINIYVLTTYQIATNYLEELSQKYDKLLDASFKRGHLFEFISPSKLIEILQKVSKKLPSNLIILPSPMYKMEIKQVQGYIHIFGYFHISETTKYSVIKATPIPRKINEDTYISVDISTKFLAIDYNNQKYFEMTDYKFENSIPVMDNAYLCTPTVVSSIENNHNCIIDELYHRTDKSNCLSHQIKIKGIVWKQLYMVNTWLFIANQPTRAAIICNSIREDVILNNTGIIKISPVCIIETKRNTLQSKTISTIPVLATYVKNITININPMVKATKFNEELIPPEPVLAPSDHMSSLITEESNIQQKIEETSWNTIHTYSSITSCVTSIMVLLIVTLVYLLWRSRKKQESASDTTSQPLCQPPAGSNEEFVLQPIYAEAARNV